VLIAVALGACGGAHPEPRAAAVVWPVPQGWRSETFTFPIEFAPAIQHRGSEELRFPKGFADASSPEFWSYAFVWWLDDDRAVDAATLGVDLPPYYDGLAKAVDAESHKLPAGALATPTVATLHDEGAQHDEGAHRVIGDIAIWDAFTTGARVTLHVKVSVVRCGGRRAAVFALSPAASDAAIWKQLDGVVGSLGCRG